MSAYNPLTTPVDFVVLQGQASPGTGVLVGVGSPREWEERKGYGASGSVLVFMGRRLAKFSLQLTLATDADWEAWDKFRPLVDRPPLGKRPQAMTIQHPWLTMHDIKAAVVEDWTGPVMGDKGDAVITIDFREYRRLKVSYAKPTDAAPTKSTDPYDSEIDTLVGQFRTRLGQ